MTRKHHPRLETNTSLILQLSNGGNAPMTLDFNRYNYQQFPRSLKIKSGQVQRAVRHIPVEQIYEAFRHSHYAPASRCDLFIQLKRYIIFCDARDYSTFTQQSLSAYSDHLIRACQQGKLKNSTYTTTISVLKQLFILIDLPDTWFHDLPAQGKNQIESFRGYSDGDLKKLLPLLRAFFRQLSQQFMLSPEEHFFVSQSKKSLNFVWKGATYRVYGAVSKLMASAVYLLAYYTWGNTTSLLTLQRPEQATADTTDIWYQMPVFKRRAFRVITLQIGDHDHLNIPKYSLEFFNQLLTLSTRLSPATPGRLFHTVSSNGVIPLSSVHLAALSRFIKKHFHLTDDRGLPLHPVISRFRATGSQRVQLIHPASRAALILGNTSRTVRRHYSSGNQSENDRMLQDTVTILSHKARYCEDTEAAKARRRKESGVRILTYENLLKQAAPPIQQAHGTYCGNPTGPEAAQFILRVQRHALLSTEKLVCSDLLACFSCPHQVIVAGTTDIWCLLSFKACVEESLYQHITPAHYYKNYGLILESINHILERIDKKTVTAAFRKLLDEGPHPLWQDPTLFHGLSYQGKA